MSECLIWDDSVRKGICLTDSVDDIICGHDATDSSTAAFLKSTSGNTVGFHLVHLLLIMFSTLAVDLSAVSEVFSQHTYQITNLHLDLQSFRLTLHLHESIVPCIRFSNQDDSSHDSPWLSHQMCHRTEVSRGPSGSGLLGWWDGALINSSSCKDESFWTPVYLPLVARIAMH